SSWLRSAKPLMKRRVLIVDDETSLLFAARQYLTDIGFEVECAQEWEEAQALLANVPFDVVITDIRLTPLQAAEGLRLIDFIRHRRLGVPVIVLTAHATADIEHEARRLGTHFESAAVLFDYVRLKRDEVRVDRYCCENAIGAAARLGVQHVLTLNAHASTLERDRTFPSLVLSACEAAGFPPDRLVMEIV